jgi:hypothetical protein
MATKQKPVIALAAPVTIAAAEKDGEKKGPPKFSATFYTGGAMDIAGWDLPVVIDLEGLDRGNVLVANLDHDSTKRVGNFALDNDGNELIAHGTATARTAARDEVVGSAEDGYQWQASLEVTPREVETVKKGKSVEINGRTLEGPLYVTRKGTLKGFAFVSHGADDNTSATIAAQAASAKEPNQMKAEVKAWVESLGLKADELTAEQSANFEADFEGREGKRIAAEKKKTSNPFEQRKLEAKRCDEIREIADKMIERRGRMITEKEISDIEKMCDHAIEAGMTPIEFKVELQDATLPVGNTIRATQGRGRELTERILEAAVCQHGRLPDLDKFYSDQEQQYAHDRFKGRISLKQLFLVCAQANGYQESTMDVTLDVQRAAFGVPSRHGMMHATGFSTIDIANIVSNTANKFIMRGWNAVDQTALRIAKIQNVSNFHTITTVSLTDSLRYEKVGPAGEIKHGTLDELTYTNKVETYAKMLAITRQDMINDNLGALTDIPQKLGNGAMKLLNQIFWTEFLGLVSASFFAAGNSNINTGVADMTIGGLAATETIFMNQTQPDGTPMAATPAILLVPTALKATATALMSDQPLITGASGTIPAANVFSGRFRLESSPYISNSSYTGNTAVGYWMLADPNEVPVIAIAALNGRVEPTVETADADFNVLGVQMRGYSDVGVNEQEYRGGVYADGGSS